MVVSWPSKKAAASATMLGSSSGPATCETWMRWSIPPSTSVCQAEPSPDGLAAPAGAPLRSWVTGRPSLVDAGSHQDRGPGPGLPGCGESANGDDLAGDPLRSPLVSPQRCTPAPQLQRG